MNILMKQEQFDDPRLLEHMVKWGHVMGIGKFQLGLDETRVKVKPMVVVGVHDICKITIKIHWQYKIAFYLT